ncbi:MAG: AAA family ATPase [Oxalobacter sp.]|nr:AAA family ATPase [Oxalobacter sp.]
MSISTIIIGESGSGKTSALRNMDGTKVALIQVVPKPLPFRSTGWKPFATDRHDKIIAAMQKAADGGYKVIVIDDFQYLMSNEFMARAYEKGYDKFTELARHAWEVITKATCLPDDVRVYILSHIATGDDGIARLKTIGKLLDEKITLEGMVTVVLRTAVMDGDYRFRVKNSGSDTVKTPIGMFEGETIENDLKLVDETIRDYYGIKEQPIKKGAK